MYVEGRQDCVIEQVDGGHGQLAGIQALSASTINRSRWRSFQLYSRNSSVLAELFPPVLTSERKVMFRASGQLEYQTVIERLEALRAHGVETFGIR